MSFAFVHVSKGLSSKEIPLHNKKRRPPFTPNVSTTTTKRKPPPDVHSNTTVDGRASALELREVRSGARALRLFARPLRVALGEIARARAPRRRRRHHRHREHKRTPKCAGAPPQKRVRDKPPPKRDANLPRTEKREVETTETTTETKNLEEEKKRRPRLGLLEKHANERARRQIDARER